MRVFIGGEFSGVVRRAFAARGHFVVSCDLLPCEDNAPWGIKDYSVGWHYQGCMFDFIYGDSALMMDAGFDLGIFHPTCTFLCQAGVRWLYKGGRKENGKDPARWRAMYQGTRDFKKCLEAPFDKIAVENSEMHKYAVNEIGRDADCWMQPWQHGHGETKLTGFHLKNLDPLEPTNIVNGREARVHKASPGDDRWKERSRFLPGPAEAMAIQWGGK